jgi:glycosyltransferase involved in cell wall biosynthesis
MEHPAVLHVMSPLGGGVDRHVRDIVAAVPRSHVLWHAGDRAEVIEVRGARRYFPLDPARIDADRAALAAWLRARGVGLVHLHAVARAPRRRAEWAAQALGLPLLVTLHDVLFLRPDAFEHARPQASRPWVDEVAPALRRAAAVLAPSGYIRDLAARTFPGLDVHVVPNGLEPPDAAPGPAPAARAEFLADRPQRVVAVLGAIGRHKGADLLRELPAHLEGSGIGLVVIGYLDQQLFPGWNPRPHVYVHGPYHPGHTAALLQAYGAELALFPNQVPESFSYSLSEAWSAGIPVLAGPAGAIGERVSRHGGGWLLPEGFDAAAIAAQICRILSPPAAGEYARVKSGLRLPDANRVPTLDAMAESLEAYYRRYGDGRATPASGDDAPIDALLAPSLDSSLFRQELAFLASLCDQSGSESKRARDFELEARRWIAKLELDVSTLQDELRREFDERQRLARELAAAQAVAGVASRLPAFVKRILARLARNARS